jgi:hypothetical protein
LLCLGLSGVTAVPLEVQMMLASGDPEVRVAAWRPVVKGRAIDWSKIVQTTRSPRRSLSLRSQLMREFLGPV